MAVTYKDKAEYFYSSVEEMTGFDESSATNEEAINELVARKSRVIRIGQGDFYFDMSASPYIGIDVVKDLRIVGAGKQKTRLRIKNYVGGSDGSLISLASGVNLTIEEITLDGPDEDVVCYGIHAIGGSTVVAKNCEFNNFTEGIRMGDGASESVVFDGCDFNTRGVATGGDAEYCLFRDTKITGDNELSFFDDGTPAQDVFVHCDRLDLSETTGANGGLSVVNPDTKTFTITGTIKWGSNAPSIGALSSIKGYLGFYPGVGANKASAASVTFDGNYDTYHVTGTTTINNIYILSATATRIFRGPLYIIADGAFAFSAAGNILPSSTSPRVVGEIYQFTYDTASGKWLEVSSGAGSALDVGWLNVRDYGATGDGSTNDSTAVSSAVAAAIAAGKPLYFPKGTYMVDAATSYILAITDDLTCFGDGKDLSILRMYNWSFGTPSVLFHLYLGKNLTIKDMNIEGPTATLGSDPAAGCTGILGLGQSSVVMLTGAVVKNFNKPIKMTDSTASQSGKVFVKDCDFENRGVLNVQQDTTGEVAELWCSDSVFKITTDGFAGAGNYVLWADHGVGFAVVNCHFLGDGAKAEMCVVSLTGSKNPLYPMLVSGCTFNANIEKYVHGNTHTGTTLVGNTYILNQRNDGAVRVVGGTTSITGENYTWLSGDENVFGIVDGSIGAGSLTVTNCNFESIGGNYGGVRIRRLAATGQGPTLIESCRFGNTNSASMPIQVDDTALGAYVVMSKCVFTGTVGVATVYQSAGTVVYKDCIFAGSKKHTVAGMTEACVTEFWRCKTTISGYQIYGVGPSETLGVTINGADNDFNITTALFGIQTSGTITGNYISRVASGGTYTYASNTISLGESGNFYQINEGGTPTVNDISYSSAAGNATTMRGGTTITLYATQAFTLANNAGTTGTEILTGSGANKAVAAGAIATLCYNTSLASWVVVSISS